MRDATILPVTPKSSDIERIGDAINGFGKLKIAILGDLMLDRFVYGEVSRISPEAPVPVLAKTREEFFPGGAANVAMNVVSMGGAAIQIGAVGADAHGKLLLKLLKSKSIDTSGIVKLEGEITTIKSRFVSMGQQLMRLDEERRLGIASPKSALPGPSLLKGCDALLVSDYNKGIVPLLAEFFIGTAAAAGIRTVVDPKPPNWPFYSGCDVVTPNRKECLSTMPEGALDGEEPAAVARAVKKTARSKTVVMTWGAVGLYTFDGKAARLVPSHRVPVYDQTGAGDSVIAALTLSLAAGLPLHQAAVVANAAGAAAVSRPGIAHISRDDIMKILSGKIG